MLIFPKLFSQVQVDCCTLADVSESLLMRKKLLLFLAVFDTAEVGTVSSNTDISRTPSSLTAPGASRHWPGESWGRPGRWTPGDLASRQKSGPWDTR